MAGNPKGDVSLELAIQTGQALKDLQAATAALREFGRGTGEALRPPNDAMKGLGATLQDFKRGEVREGRLVGFYVRELTTFTGASAGAQEAMGGLIQGLVGLSSATSTLTSPLIALWAGFEIFKGVFAFISEGAEKAKQKTQELLDVSRNAMSVSVYGAAALKKLTDSKPTEGTKAFQEVFAEVTKDVDKFNESVEKLRPTKWQQFAAFMWDGAGGIKAVNDEFAAAAARLDGMVESAKMFATAARDVSGGYEESPDQDKRYWQIQADDFKANQAAALAATQSLANLQGEMQGLAERHHQTIQRIKDNVQVEEDTRRRMLQVEEREYALAVQLSQLKRMPVAEAYTGFEDGPRQDPDAELQRQADEETKRRDAQRIREDQAANGRMAESYDAGTFDLSGISATQTAMERIRKEAALAKEDFMALGAGIGSAFSSIGAAVGGAAGQFISMVGQMIGQAVALIVALTMSDTLALGPVGLFAAIPAAAGMLAAVIGLIAGVPSFDVGTDYVPKTGLALVHQGERIITAADNARGVGTTNVTIHAADAASFERMLRNNDNALVRVLRDSQRAGRGV